MKRVYFTKSSTRKIVLAATALILSAVVVGVFFLYPKQTYLEIISEEHHVYQKFPVEDGTEFSVMFIHSVNKSPVEDFYRIEGKDIYVVKTKYDSFGAGVQTKIEEGQTLSYTEDGSMVVSGFHQKIPRLAYVVGMVSDHVLTINGEKISLRNLCGKGSYIEFCVR